MSADLVLPAAQFGSLGPGELCIQEQHLADLAVVILPVWDLVVLTPAAARQLAADLVERANHIDPAGGEP